MNQGSIGDREEWNRMATAFDLRRSTLRYCTRHGFRTFGRRTDPSGPIRGGRLFSQKGSNEIRNGSVDLYRQH